VGEGPGATTCRRPCGTSSQCAVVAPRVSLPHSTEPITGVRTGGSRTPAPTDAAPTDGHPSAHQALSRSESPPTFATSVSRDRDAVSCRRPTPSQRRRQ
jgi:hypothetical protein